MSQIAASPGFLADMLQGFHMPVVNIPAFIGDHGMPVGVSLVASRYHDAHLLRLSRALGDVLMAGGGWRV